MLAVLDVFTPEHAVLTAEDVISRLGYSRGTAYRYIRELCMVGLLCRVGGFYALGPRVIELDAYIRDWDPILRASRPVMQQLRDKLDCDVLLTSFYEDRVVVSHHEPGSVRITMSFGRGRVMPLFRGAGSKVIIASLPPARQKRLHAAHGETIAAAGLGEDWGEFRRRLQEIRRAGVSVSFGELDQGNVGVAVPIFYDRPNPPGSIVLVLSASRYAIVDKALVEKILKAAVEQIDQSLKHLGDPQNLTDLPEAPRRRSRPN